MHLHRTSSQSLMYFVIIMHANCMKGLNMTALQVRDMPPTLYEKLKRSASESHRSISQQTIHVIESFFSATRTGKTPFIKGNRNCEAAKIHDEGHFGSGLRGGVVSNSPSCEELEKDTDTIEDLVEKRRRIFEEIDRINAFRDSRWKEFPDPADVVRQMRQERSDHLSQVLGLRV